MFYRLIEIFGVNKPFGGISVIACDGFYQLPPVNPPAIYSTFDLEKVTVKCINGLELGCLFKMVDARFVISVRSDTRLIEVSKKIRVKDVLSLLISSLAVQNKIFYPIDTLHLFAEKASADAQNNLILK